MKNIPLTNQKEAVRVNVLHYEEITPKARKVFTWVTDLPLTKPTVLQTSKIGRSRWKIENETFNTLKNQGYNFEHNYGHGNQNLCTVMAYLMFLAFLIDQIYQQTCPLFNGLWKNLKQKSKVWESIRAHFLLIPCSSMKNLFKNLWQIWNIPYSDP